MMKMTINDISVLYGSIEKLKSKNLPAKLSYIISLNSQILQAEVAAAENARLDLCKKMAKKDKDGNPVMVKKKDGSEAYDVPNMPELISAVSEMYQTEVEVEIKTLPVSIDDLMALCDAPKYDALSAYDIETIEKMLSAPEK